MRQPWSRFKWVNILRAPDGGEGGGGGGGGQQTPEQIAAAEKLATEMKAAGKIQVGDQWLTPTELAEKHTASEKERKELITARDKAKEKARLEEEERLKGEGKFKELHEQAAGQVKTLEAENTSLKAALEGYLTQEISGIPEDKRALIPEGSVADRLAWVQKAKASGLFGETTKAPNNLKLPGEGGKVDLSKMSGQEKLRYARQQQAAAKK